MSQQTHNSNRNIAQMPLSRDDDFRFFFAGRETREEVVDVLSHLWINSMKSVAVMEGLSPHKPSECNICADYMAQLRMAKSQGKSINEFWFSPPSDADRFRRKAKQLKRDAEALLRQSKAMLESAERSEKRDAEPTIDNTSNGE